MVISVLSICYLCHLFGYRVMINDLTIHKYNFKLNSRLNMENVNQLNSPSLKKQKFQVFKIKSQAFGDENYHYIYLSSENARILLLVNKKVFFLFFISS